MSAAVYLPKWNQLPNHHMHAPAEWTPKNAHLQAGIGGICLSKHLGLCQKICLLFKRLIEAIVRCFTPSSFEKSIQSALIPTSVENFSKIEQAFDKWENENTHGFTRHCWDLTTPDNQKIHALFYARFEDVEKSKALPTLIYFQGMTGESFTTTEKLLKFFSTNKTPCNVIVFDYRASGINRLLHGERHFNARNLILDGDTVVQAALQFGLKTTHFLGVSFGGAIGSFVAHMHSGRFVNYNSFTSLSDVLNKSSAIRRFYEQFVLKHAEKRFPWTCLKKLSANRALCMLSTVAPYWGWDLDPKTVLPSMKDRTCCVHHPQDAMIPAECAAFQAAPLLLESYPSEVTESGEKYVTKQCEKYKQKGLDEEMARGVALHTARPKHLISKNTKMEKIIIDFIFTPLIKNNVTPQLLGLP